MQIPPEILESATIVDRKLRQLAEVFRGSEIVRVASMSHELTEFLEKQSLKSLQGK